MARGLLRHPKWEAGTCKSDTVPGKCTYSSPESQFFTQAAGHPPTGLTDFAVNTTGGVPDGASRTPGSTSPRVSTSILRRSPSAPKATFESNALECAASQVGISEVTSEIAGLPVGPLPFAVYNLDPPQGVPALFGFTVGLPLIPIANVYLVADVAYDSDYHEGFTISDIPTTLPAGREPPCLRRHQRRHVPDDGEPVQRAFHDDPQGGLLRKPRSVSAYTTKPAGPGRPVNSDGCRSVPFAPAIATASESAVTDSPSGSTST